jgi:hypothetical protein
MSIIENNYFTVVDFGVFHIYFSEGSIYIRKYDGNKWSAGDAVLKGSLNDFDVCCTENQICILAEKTDGNIYYTTYSLREKTQKNILTSKSHTPSINNIRLVYADNLVHAFYVLNYDNKKLLVHHIPSKTQTPVVISEVSSRDYLVLTDADDNINLFLERENKNIKCILKKSKRYTIAESFTETLFKPLAACIFENNICLLHEHNNSFCMTFGNKTNVQIHPAAANNTTAETFEYNGKIHTLFITKTTVHSYISEGAGKEFTKLMPQTVTRTPALKIIKIRKHGLNITLPGNAERGYIRSMVLPIEKLLLLNDDMTKLKKEELMSKLLELEDEIKEIKNMLKL